MASFFTFKNEHFISLLLLIGASLFLFFHFSPLTMNGFEVGGADVRGSKGQTNLVSEWQKNSGEKALWNPAIFSGIPSYYSEKTSTLNFDTILFKAAHLFTGRKIANLMACFLLGLVGMFLLFRQFNFSPYVAIFGGLAFVMSVHWAILLEVGHFMKFRPIMMIPIVLWSFLRFAKTVTLLNTTLFAFFLASQIRTGHYQIIFYMALFLLFIGVWQVYEKMKANDSYGKFLLLTATALLLTFGMVSQQLIMTSEFSKETMRGGNGESGEKATSGLAYDYATSWSLHPTELMEMIIPRFHGGGGREFYDGSNPQLAAYKGQAFPGYHGHQPFREGSADYLGAIVAFFALLGIIVHYKNRMIQVLMGFTVLSILIAFGKELPLVYQLFYEFVPHFDKFRIPSMILVMVQVTAVIFAGFGLQSVIAIENKKSLYKPLLISTGVLGGIGLITMVLASSFDYLTAAEATQYKGQQAQIITMARQDFLEGDAKRLLLFVLTLAGLSFAFLTGKLKNVKVYVGFVILLVLFDQVTLHKRYMLHESNGVYTHLSKPQDYTTSVFSKTKTDAFILSQKETNHEFADFRVYPLTRDFWNTNDYSYYHQSIGGYSAAKMRIQQDLMDFGRYQNSGLLSRNIPDMLNAKYWFLDGQLPSREPFENLELVYTDGKRHTYLNKQALGKAWFVGNSEIVTDKSARMQKLVDRGFKPSETAVLEKELPETIETPENDSVRVVAYNPNTLELWVKNEKQSLLVVSDIYYPHGWTATINASETEIYKTNHAIRSILVPKGEHKITFTFMPKSYATGSSISFWSTFIAFLLLLVGGALEFRRARGRI